MLNVEGTFGYILIMAFITVTGTILVTHIFKEIKERKGIIGMFFICFFISFYLIWQARAVAVVFGVGRSDVLLIGILFFVIPTTVLLVLWREKIKKTANFTKTMSQKARSTKRKVQQRVSRK